MCIRDRVITLQNDGTKPVPINVKATMKSDNGYLGLTLDDRFYQIGHPEEVDGKKYEVNVTLFDDHMWKDRGWLLNQMCIRDSKRTDLGSEESVRKTEADR